MEWKFARTQLWMNYIEEGSTLPVPFNMIPTPKSVKYAIAFLRGVIEEEMDEPVKYDFSVRVTARLMVGQSDRLTYASVDFFFYYFTPFYSFTSTAVYELAF